MATIIITEDYAGKSGDATLDTREYDRQLTARTSAPVSFAAISEAPGCPKKMSIFGPDDFGARCVRLSIKQDKDNQLIWRIAAHYSTDFGDLKQQQQPNPLLRPAIWRYNSERGEKPQAIDRQNKAYETTAGEPFESPPPVIYSTARYSITRNQESFSSKDADDWANTVNSDTWYAKRPGTVLCEGIDCEEKYDGEYHFFIVTFRLHVDRNYWQPIEIQNRGYKYRDADNNEQISPTMVWLNAAGKIWQSGVDPETDKCVYRHPYDAIPFAQFQL